MRVISKARLKQFWQRHSQSEGPLQAWYTHVNSKSIAWHSWGELKADFQTASLIGTCIVFNVGGNKFRPVTRVLYPSQKVFVLKVMTHAEYDANRWQAECGCYHAQPPPKRKPLRRETSNLPPRRKDAP